ncbi:hypothetical protein HPG69_010063 [Diceros bicornis minor]|uniref:Beta-defensin n=1 Tax=Diceros bicornis minor TaxID=77932 RepID=A0A7J7EQ32_DICBM|nr:hypothetical protein HPG69_010063 [Diceros bicornis minor]
MFRTPGSATSFSKTMKFLLLTLTVFLVLFQMLPVCRGRKTCWIIKGHCRKDCKFGEQVKRPYAIETTIDKFEEIVTHGVALENWLSIHDQNFEIAAEEDLNTYGGGKKCWNNQGHCRKNCKADEVVKSACKNHQACCVSVKDGHRQVAANKKIPITTPSYDVKSNIIDVLITISPTTTNFDLIVTNKEEENSDPLVWAVTGGTSLIDFQELKDLNNHQKEQRFQVQRFRHGAKCLLKTYHTQWGINWALKGEKEFITEMKLVMGTRWRRTMDRGNVRETNAKKIWRQGGQHGSILDGLTQGLRAQPERPQITDRHQDCENTGYAAPASAVGLEMGLLGNLLILGVVDPRASKGTTIKQMLVSFKWRDKRGRRGAGGQVIWMTKEEAVAHSGEATELGPLRRLGFKPRILSKGAQIKEKILRKCVCKDVGDLQGITCKAGILVGMCAFQTRLQNWKRGVLSGPLGRLSEDVESF